ncbi:unnamed protein product [Rotaria sp. Silwood2]|nr:unnamed protein product [Rotaria sp. Silwood2]CAF3378485.1 unnamed protein product [Rotaria sp. Silwood2]CAF4310372.1 unnamed protein product [Rotaria sp. Silwood2]CAF4643872.1 unnamed protein product [Rotaria sp. Silwood2]
MDINENVQNSSPLFPTHITIDRDVLHNGPRHVSVIINNNLNIYVPPHVPRVFEPIQDSDSDDDDDDDDDDNDDNESNPSTIAIETDSESEEICNNDSGDNTSDSDNDNGKVDSNQHDIKEVPPTNVDTKKNDPLN